jgi:hypothetical protein
MDKVKHEGFDRVYSSIDGTFGLAEEVVQQNLILREVVSTYTRENGLAWNLIFREKRFGIVKNFTTSIDQAFETVDHLCILEDDCLPAPGFLEYFRNVLIFGDSNRVKMFTFFRPDIEMISQGYFATHNPLMWGWGLSKQNWDVIKQSIAPTSAIKGLAKLKSLPFQSFYYSGYSRAVSQENDALDALVAYYLLINDYLVVGPPVSLISNIGYGSLATNTQEKSAFMGVEISDWKPKDHDNHLNLSSFSIFKNDLAIARCMNQWKIHHIFSSYLKRLLLKRFGGKM